MLIEHLTAAACFLIVILTTTRKYSESRKVFQYISRLFLPSFFKPRKYRFGLGLRTAQGKERNYEEASLSTWKRTRDLSFSKRDSAATKGFSIALPLNLHLISAHAHIPPSYPLGRISESKKMRTRLCILTKHLKRVLSDMLNKQKGGFFRLQKVNRRK